MNNTKESTVKGSKKAARFAPAPAVTVRQRKAVKASQKVPRKVAKALVPTARTRRQTTLIAGRRSPSIAQGY